LGRLEQNKGNPAKMSGEEAQSSVPGALVQLYLERRSALLRFLTARTGSAEEAEDIVQEMYFRLASVNPDEVQTGISYLYKMGLNLAVDRLRSKKRAHQRDGAYFDAHGSSEGDEPIVDSPDPEGGIDARRRLEWLLKAVDSLPPQCARVFQLHKFEGKSHSEVAALLGISRSAVEKHMMTALKRLTAWERS
jgi:RNA polymerase sigma factor (sigma-70 family)